MTLEQNTITRRISDHDDVLSIMRDKWMRAEGSDKGIWMQKIDGILDERIRLMAIRDQMKEPK